MPFRAHHLVPNPQTALTHRFTNQDTGYPNQGCTKVRVGESMKYGIPPTHPDQNLDIYGNLRETEDREAEISAAEDLERCSGAEVKRREWHMRSCFESLAIIPAEYSCREVLK